MPVGKCPILKHYKTTEKLPDYLQVARFFPAQGLMIRKGRTMEIPIVCQKKKKCSWLPHLYTKFLKGGEEKMQLWKVLPQIMCWQML